MPTINIIGNNASNNVVSDGGRIKIRLYKDLLEREGFNVHIIELDGWKKHPFKIIKQIRKAIKNKERIIVMAGPKGCRKVIPLVFLLNKNRKSKVIFCPLGIGTLDYVLQKSDFKDSQAFLNGELELRKKDIRMGRYLAKCEHVILQNKTLLNAYKKYYSLSNLSVLENFRDYHLVERKYEYGDTLSIVYASRVKEYKGVIDLMKTVNEINLEFGNIVKLDIYGDNQLTEDENIVFQSLQNDCVSYKGVVQSQNMINLLKKYDLFVLPTKYYGEGTPGSLIESMLAGTPALVSSYSQANDIIKKDYSGFLYEFGSNESMKKQIIYIYNNKQKLAQIGIQAQLESKKYTFDFNKKQFIELMAGEAI